ncbi:phospholipase-like protein [Tanacetum coccineum]|uniref:Phospholipase-like protein n=1 Tax=Tanacetum coccineum TaxID=301880 RepID=A0ABQ5FAI4_9ASTR
MFENDNEHDFKLVIDMRTNMNDLGIRIRQRVELILDVEKQGYSPEVFETVKLLKDLQETDNAKASYSFRNFKSGDVTFVLRLLPYKLGLKVSNLDLLGLIEDEELFGKLVDDDAVRICLLLALEVNLDLTPTISEQQTIWYMAFHKFYMSYIPRSPLTTYTDLFDDYMKKLSSLRKRGKIDTRDLPIIRRCDTTSVEEIRLKDGVIAKLNSRVFKLEAIIKVLDREQKGVSLDKSCVAEIFNNFSSSCWEELNEEFNELCETKFCVNGPAMIDLDSDEDLEYLLQEESRLKQEEEERFRLEEHKMMKALFLKTLQEEVQRREEKEKMLNNGKRTQKSSAVSAYYWENTFAKAEKDRPLNTINDQDMNLFLKDVTLWVEDLSRYNRATDRVHLTDVFDIFLGRQGPLRCRFRWIMDEHVELWVNYMWHFRPHDADWAMVGAYFVQLLLQDSIPSWYADGSLYKVSWCDVEQAKILEVMMQAKVFDQKGIDHTRYTISFTNAVNVPKQGGVFGDCGIWTCIFLYRLLHGLSLDVDNPIQIALAYREHIAELFLSIVLQCGRIQRPNMHPGSDDRGYGYFIWKDDFMKRISSSGPSTPPSLYTRPSRSPSYYAGTSSLQ